MTRILHAAIQAVEPGNAVRNYLKVKGHTLIVNGGEHDLIQFERILVIAFGKASLPMMQAAAEILGENLHLGIAITKSQDTSSKTQEIGYQFADLPVSVFPASHPVPDQSSLTAAECVLDTLSTTTDNDLVIFLISGGGSALLTAPVEDVSLKDLQALTRSLLASGATINEINCLRKHLSKVKGGQLARYAAPAQVVTLILSDVVGDPLDVIASGPTVPDPTTYQDALAVLAKLELINQVPHTIVAHLERGASREIPDTPKKNDPIFKRVQNVIVGNNYQASRAALAQAQSEGFNTLLLTTSLQGEARLVGPTLAAILRQITLTSDPISRPACLIAGGETTVTIQGDGWGGRNQELALSAVEALAGLSDVLLITLATDGEDGPTDAAGAVVTGETQSRAQPSGLDSSAFLARNASYEFFDPLGDLLQSGPTHTNVNDLTFLFAF